MDADIYTEQAQKLFKEHFGPDTETFFVFTGTAANVLGYMRSYPVMEFCYNCNNSSSGDRMNAELLRNLPDAKFLQLIHRMEKLHRDLIEKHMHGFDFEHHSQPKVISITQSTEMGTVYTVR